MEAADCSECEQLDVNVHVHHLFFQIKRAIHFVSNNRPRMHCPFAIRSLVFMYCNRVYASI